MAMTIETVSRSDIGVGLSDWSAAEFLDMPLADGNILRALVCRLGAGRWQWSISSMHADSGELISIGVENSVAAARRVAASEIEKCLDSAVGIAGAAG
jgi:hypothetical protein